jgi:hypothetical protein
MQRSGQMHGLQVTGVALAANVSLKAHKPNPSLRRIRLVGARYLTDQIHNSPSSMEQRRCRLSVCPAALFVLRPSGRQRTHAASAAPDQHLAEHASSASGKDGIRNAVQTQVPYEVLPNHRISPSLPSPPRVSSNAILKQGGLVNNSSVDEYM